MTFSIAGAALCHLGLVLVFTVLNKLLWDGNNLFSSVARHNARVFFI